jgi:predicted NBD/HSP70 family sugar kinase
MAAEELRRHNLSAVLERLHLLGPRSRSELTAVTGLNRSTIADLIGELTDLGLADERPGATSTGPGRPSLVVRARPTGAIALAIEIAVDSIAMAAVGLGGHVFGQQRMARSRARTGPGDTTSDLVPLMHRLLGSLPPDHRIAGVGVSVAGITRRDDGVVRLGPNLGWSEVPLGSLLVDALGIDTPVLIANEADLGALGEYRRGLHPGVRNLVYVHGEVGIGVGIIADGRPLVGTAGYAGEAGHMKVNPNGRICRCGGLGCWETEAGEAALLRLMDTPSDTGLASVESIESRASTGDPVVLDAMAGIGRWLGLGIGNLINIFNPEIVVLGGMYHRLFPFIETTMTQAVSRSALRAATDLVSIVPSGLGVEAALVGAGEAALSRVIANPAGQRTTAVDAPLA